MNLKQKEVTKTLHSTRSKTNRSSIHDVHIPNSQAHKRIFQPEKVWPLFFQLIKDNDFLFWKKKKKENQRARSSHQCFFCTMCHQWCKTFLKYIMSSESEKEHAEQINVQDYAPITPRQALQRGISLLGCELMDASILA